MPEEDPWYFDITAKGIVKGEGYHVRNLLAYQPPLFTYFIAANYRIFGFCVDCVRITQAFIGSLVCLLLFFIAREVGTLETGLLSALLASVFPQLIRYSVELYSENLFIFIVLSAILAFVISEKKSSVSLKISTGILLGLASLTREVGLFILLGILVWYCLFYKNVWVSIKKWSIIALFTLLTILPWSIRNYSMFKAIVPLSTNGGINFYIGNNENANGEFKWAIPPGAKWNEKSPRGRLELQASWLGYKEGLKFIMKEPLDFLKLTAKRLFLLWRPPYHNINLQGSLLELIFRLSWLIMYSFLFLFSLILSPRYLREEFRSWSLFLIMILFLSLPYFVTFVGSRYQIPLVPFMSILASAAVCRKLLSSRLRGSTKADQVVKFKGDMAGVTRKKCE